jgi:hypothetical protein
MTVHRIVSFIALAATIASNLACITGGCGTDGEESPDASGVDGTWGDTGSAELAPFVGDEARALAACEVVSFDIDPPIDEAAVLLIGPEVTFDSTGSLLVTIEVGDEVTTFEFTDTQPVWRMEVDIGPDDAVAVHFGATADLVFDWMLEVSGVARGDTVVTERVDPQAPLPTGCEGAGGA